MAKHLDVKGWIAVILVAATVLVGSALYLQTVDAAQDITLTEHEGRLDTHDTQLEKLQNQDGKLDTIIRILEEKKKGGTP